MNTVSDVQALFLLLAIIAGLIGLWNWLRPNRNHPTVGPRLVEVRVSRVPRIPIATPVSTQLSSEAVQSIRVLTALNKERTANSVYNQLRRDGCEVPLRKWNIQVVLNRLASQGFIRRTRRNNGVSTYATT